MLTISHISMAKNTLHFLKIHNIDILHHKSFIYGNIKPDNLFQKTPKKHLELEALDFIIEEIENFDYNCNNKEMSIKLGVICHYLCDFFCLPHFERWSACHISKKVTQTPRHLNYERMLNPYTSYAVLDYKKINDLRSFINECKSEYIKDKSFKNDIKYASIVCNSVMFYILESKQLKSVVNDTMA